MNLSSPFRWIASALVGCAIALVPAPSASAQTAPAAAPVVTLDPDARPADGRPAAPASKDADKDKDKKPAKQLSGRPQRVAVLNFGPPSDWQGKAGDTVGVEISAKAFDEAIAMLERDNVDIVVIRINSGGGLLLEVGRFHRVFAKYQQKFRTVMWVESAISAAAMSPWVLREMYMLPQGNIGGAVAHMGGVAAVEGAGLEQVLFQMEEASRVAGRSPFIARAMQLEEPLSCTPDAGGNFTWFQDETGQFIVNPVGRVLTLTANEAIKYKIAQGIAADLNQLMQAMGVSEWEVAGKRGTDHVDRSLITNTEAEKRFGEVYTKYSICVQGAQNLDAERRQAEVGRARQFLNQMRKWVEVNPNIGMMRGVDDNWFQAQERNLRDLLRRR